MRRSDGQATTEYMLAISVIIIAIVVAAIPLADRLNEGIDKFGKKFETYYAECNDQRCPK